MQRGAVTASAAAGPSTAPASSTSRPVDPAQWVLPARSSAKGKGKAKADQDVEFEGSYLPFLEDEEAPSAGRRTFGMAPVSFDGGKAYSRNLSSRLQSGLRGKSSKRLSRRSCLSRRRQDLKTKRQSHRPRRSSSRLGSTTWRASQSSKRQSGRAAPSLCVTTRSCRAPERRRSQRKRSRQPRMHPLSTISPQQDARQRTTALQVMAQTVFAVHSISWWALCLYPLKLATSAAERTSHSRGAQKALRPSRLQSQSSTNDSHGSRIPCFRSAQPRQRVRCSAAASCLGVSRLRLCR